MEMKVKSFNEVGVSKKESQNNSITKMSVNSKLAFNGANFRTRSLEDAPALKKSVQST